MLLARQEGYRWRAGHRETIEPGWDARWLVIGDIGDDPVIARTDLSGTPIAMAEHGQGVWAPVLIAPSLAAYLHAVAAWVEVSAITFEGDIRDDESWIRPTFRRSLDELCWLPSPSAP